MPVLSYGRSSRLDRPSTPNRSEGNANSNDLSRSLESFSFPHGQNDGHRSSRESSSGFNNSSNARDDHVSSGRRKTNLTSHGNIFTFLNRNRRNSESAVDSAPPPSTAISSSGIAGVAHQSKRSSATDIASGSEQRSRTNSPTGTKESAHNTSTHPQSTTSTDSIDIYDYCMGKPERVAQSHSGSVKLSVCLQEEALFLPTVKPRSQRNRRGRSDANIGSSGSVRDQPSSNSGRSTRSVDELYGSHHPEHHDDDEGSDDMDDPGALHRNSDGGTSETTTHRATRDTTTTTMRGEPTAGLNEHGYEHDDDYHNNNNYENHEEQHVELNNTIYGEANTVSGAAANEPVEALPSYSEMPQEDGSTSCATLRGSVLLELTRPTKIKEIGVSFSCMSSTMWNLLPQSSLMNERAYQNSAQVEDMAYLGIHHWDFVPVEQFGSAQGSYDKVCGSQSGTLIGQDLYGADVAVFRNDPGTVHEPGVTRLINSSNALVRQKVNNNVPVFGALKSQPRKMRQTSVHVDGVNFPPGSYVYNFTLLVDAKTPGSVNLSNGQVKFALGAKVYRTGPFAMNVSGAREVEVVHIPSDFTEGECSGPLNDQVLLSRVWENMFVYYINLERRSIALDAPTKLSVTLFPLDTLDVKVHQVQVFINEVATYVYSMDPTIKYVDPTLKLLLSQKTAKTKNCDKRCDASAGTGPCSGHPSRANSYIQSGSNSEVNSIINSATETDTEAPASLSSGRRNHRPNHDLGLMSIYRPKRIDLDFTLASEHNNNLSSIRSQAYKRGRYGELRFLAPDVKGPYIRVKHRLQLVFHVSHGNGPNAPRNHYEVKFETRVHVLSRRCVPATISLPSYTAAPFESTTYASAPSESTTHIEEPELLDEQMPPSFDDAMDHPLLGTSGQLTVRETKAEVPPQN